MVLRGAQGSARFLRPIAASSARFPLKQLVLWSQRTADQGSANQGTKGRRPEERRPPALQDPSAGQDPPPRNVRVRGGGGSGVAPDSRSQRSKERRPPSLHHGPQGSCPARSALKPNSPSSECSCLRRGAGGWSQIAQGDKLNDLGTLVSEEPTGASSTEPPRSTER
jgi:hypothetical protein